MTAFMNANYTPQNGGQSFCPKYLDAVEVYDGPLVGSALCVPQFSATSDVSSSGSGGGNSSSNTTRSGGVSLHENLLLSGYLSRSFMSIVSLGSGSFT